MPDRVLVFCAHSDDQAFGAGGYLAKLAEQGVAVKTIICSFGEQSHPHLDSKDIKRVRVLESKHADTILGGKGVMFLGLHESGFEKGVEERALHHGLLHQLRTFKPDRILTHSEDDPHPDHRACHRIALALHDQLTHPCEVYTFNVWNFVDIGKRKRPRLVVDITDTFKKKLDALAAFRSQRHAIIALLWSVYTKAVFWGFRRGCRYGEVFYKVR